jgi:nitrous oxidase accessory protein
MFPPPGIPSALRRAARVALALVLAACVRGPAPIAYGDAECGYCRMEVTDRRFGTQLITPTGKVLTFDSIECLADYVAATQARGSSGEAWVTDWLNPGTLVRAERARFVRVGGAAGSPMGRGLVAVATDSAAATLRDRDGGATEGWREVVARATQAARPAAHSLTGTRDEVDASEWRGRDGARRTIEVSRAGPVRSIGEAVRLARAGDRILVRAGTYREPAILVDRPLTIEGEGMPTLDGESARRIMTVSADSVTIRGLRFAHVGVSYTEDLAALKVSDVSACTIEGNEFDDTFFGIYLSNVTGCRIASNVLRGNGRGEAASGNGIHLWTATGVIIEDNRISGHRDGIYFEFVHDATVARNLSEANERYGLHFMFSDACTYAENTFRRNGSGVAVMYTKRVEMRRNRFEDNWGSAAYGLLLKEISDSRLHDNRFVRNSTALLAEGANRLEASGNLFAANGWAVKLDASTLDARFTANSFVGNTFDVATSARELSSVFAGNYWDTYRGYDLDRNGVGDVPHRPVRLFSVLVERSAPSLILLRSAFVALLDVAERALPVVTPSSLTDASPAMRRLP